MKKKLNCILLVDDDSATNFLHQMIFRQLNCADKIVTAENGAEALNFLNTPENESYPQPDLILLDINMPVMNGWEFLSAYQEVEAGRRGKKILLMITVPLSLPEMEKARQIEFIHGYINKPLTKKLVLELLEEHWGFAP